MPLLVLCCAPFGLELLTALRHHTHSASLLRGLLCLDSLVRPLSLGKAAVELEKHVFQL